MVVKCGNLPQVVGTHDLEPKEMMFWMYCPIHTPNHSGELIIPANLRQFETLIDKALDHEWRLGDSPYTKYIYVTAKTLYVSGDFIGNRPGWHIDGFGTDDVNYIWCDSAPTDFIHGDFTVSEDCDQSMKEMEALGELHTPVNYPDKTLLRLDNTVIHRSPAKFEAGMRTFVKISISDDIYNLAGNSINHDLILPTIYKPRVVSRNHTSI